MVQNKSSAASANGEREEEVQSNWVRWGKMGNTIKGTLIAVRSMNSTLPGKQGEKVAIYEIKATEGEYNEMDKKTKVAIEPSITIEAGDIYNIGGKPMIDRQMRNIKLGTKIRMTYTHDIPAKNSGFSDQKAVKVFVVKDGSGQPVMDQEWLDEQAREEEVRNFDKK